MTSSLTGLYSHKIKTLEEVLSIIGARPRDKKVIMCHGTFDIVHPGHLRHLLFAKSKADILIASLTADRHITKGDHRPHVPQDLRAVNLAAFEIVDYVLIDNEATPISNIKAIQPDFFAKGYEYNASGIHPKTAEELDAVGSYGGEVIFSPGDIVYSSSRLINLAPPQIKFEKLLSLMDRESITFDDLRNTLDRMKGVSVHVVGDTIVDTYTHCTMIGGQTKTPTMSVLYETKHDFVGGAGIVAKHLRAAGAEVKFSTVLGDDDYAKFVANDLAASGISTKAVVDRSRPTTNKNAIVAGGYRLLKIDTLDNRPIDDHVLEELTSEVRSTDSQAVVFSDFRHGIFNRRTTDRLIDAIPAAVFRVADSQVASRWGNITDFKGFDLITPNEREARFALGDQDTQIRTLASNLFDVARCKTLMLKLGDRGVLTYVDSHPEDLDGWLVVDSFVGNLVDAVGAGDALLAYSTLTMVVTSSATQATILGSIAAACECELDGNIPIAITDVQAKINMIEKQATFS